MISPIISPIISRASLLRPQDNDGLYHRAVLNPSSMMPISIGQVNSFGLYLKKIDKRRKEF
jgi:hypothetical protein